MTAADSQIIRASSTTCEEGLLAGIAGVYLERTDMGKKARPIAVLHHHVAIMSHQQSDVSSEPPTRAEQLLALRRFVKWHARQVEIGGQLLASLEKGQS